MPSGQNVGTMTKAHLRIYNQWNASHSLIQGIASRLWHRSCSIPTNFSDFSAIISWYNMFTSRLSFCLGVMLKSQKNRIQCYMLNLVFAFYEVASQFAACPSGFALPVVLVIQPGLLISSAHARQYEIKSQSHSLNNWNANSKWKKRHIANSANQLIGNELKWEPFQNKVTTKWLMDLMSQPSNDSPGLGRL